MTDALEMPQIYLITPGDADMAAFPDQLAACLDTVEVACVRLRLATSDVDRLSRAADACRAVTDARDVALVIESHVVLAQRLGLDGVHLLDGARSVAAARKELGDDAIVGAFCGDQRHDGMSAGERGADYVCFGPVGDAGLGDGRVASTELFDWWSQMIEVPVVAEGALTEASIQALAPHTDFFGLGDEIWTAEDPVQRLVALHKLITT